MGGGLLSGSFPFVRAFLDFGGCVSYSFVVRGDIVCGEDVVVRVVLEIHSS